MRILVTRPQPDADNTARLLRESWHEVIIAPLLEIVATDIPESFDLTGIQAVLITSANGVRALAAATSERTIRVLAVGAASAEAARALGFVRVENAGGDVASLAELVSASRSAGISLEAWASTRSSTATTDAEAYSRFHCRAVPRRPRTDPGAGATPARRSGCVKYS